MILLKYLNPFSYFIGFSKKHQIHELEHKIKNSVTYQEWEEYAKKLDELNGSNVWKEDPSSELYDYVLIGSRLKSLNNAIKVKDRESLVRILRSELLRNLGGLGTAGLYTRVHVGTKKLIEEYVETVLKAITVLLEDPSFLVHEKFDFFWATRQSYGRSALLLSGGASLGVYHIGVIKVLFEHNLLPRVISGSSVGSIVASLVATRSDEELPELLNLTNVNLSAFDPSGSGWRKIKRFLTQGVIMDIKKLQNVIQQNIGDITFREAFEKTKRILNITVAPTHSFELPRLLNYLTAPDVVIWSAASASCALTGLYEPVELMCKDRNGNIMPYHPSTLKWSDGSVAYDLPMARLAELFNVNHFLVSQVNPHVVPFITSTREQNNSWLSTIKTLLVSELRHRISQAANIGLIPKKLDFFLGVMSQTYCGNITIVPKLSFDDYLNLLANPTTEWIKECILKSERNTWSLLSMIKQLCAIELGLDNAVQCLRRQLNNEPEQALDIYSKKLANN